MLAEYSRLKVQLSRRNMTDEQGRRLEHAAFHKWRDPLVRRYGEVVGELEELNARLRELREEE